MHTRAAWPRGAAVVLFLLAGAAAASEKAAPTATPYAFSAGSSAPSADARSGTSSSNQKVQLRLTIPAANAAAVFAKAQRAIFDAYVASHPEVEFAGAGGLALTGPTGNASSSDFLAIAGGVSPDVFSLYFRRMHSYIEQGFVMSLDDYLEKWDGLGDVPPQLWPVVTQVDKDGRARDTARSTTGRRVYLIYRRDLFAEAGSTPTSRRRTGTSSSSTAKRLSYPDMKVETAAIQGAGYGALRALPAVQRHVHILQLRLAGGRRDRPQAPGRQVGGGIRRRRPASRRSSSSRSCAGRSGSETARSTPAS